MTTYASIFVSVEQMRLRPPAMKYCKTAGCTCLQIQLHLNLHGSACTSSLRRHACNRPNSEAHRAECGGHIVM